jgi:hypothetical protein
MWLSWPGWNGLNQAEVLALGWWSTVDGLAEHYRDSAGLGGLPDALIGPPETTVWQQEAGFSGEAIHQAIVVLPQDLQPGRAGDRRAQQRVAENPSWSKYLCPNDRMPQTK